MKRHSLFPLLLAFVFVFMQTAYAGQSPFTLKLKGSKQKTTVTESRILSHRDESKKNSAKDEPAIVMNKMSASERGDNVFCSATCSQESRRGGSCGMSGGTGLAVGLGIAAAVLGLAGTIVTIVLTAGDE
jgi:hypothetical protein